MGAVARTLITIELLVSSALILLIVLTVYIKLGKLCPSNSTNEDCNKPFLNPLMIVSVFVALLGGGLAIWKISNKSKAVMDSVSQEINN